MEVDESDEAKNLLCSAPVHPNDSSASDVPSATSSHSEPDSTAATSGPAAEPSSHSNNIRRSARQQHPPDRLAYPPAAPALNEAADRRLQRAKRTHKTPAIHTGVQEWTEAEASDSSLSSCERPTRSHRQHKKRRVDTSDSNDNCGEEEQIAALVMKLKEGYSRRQEQKQLDMENVSKHAVLQLWREISADRNESTADADALTYPQYARKIDLVISVSTGLRIVGYYLRAVLAARLKCSHKTKYVRSARTVLGLKSSADIAAYPAFYSYVQEHCPSIAAGGANAEIDIEVWLQEPIFLADIGWLEWRRLLGKPHRWILDAAMEQLTSLQPAQDWMQRGWVEEYDDVNLGRGVRAVRDIPLRTSKGDSAAVAADLAVLSQTLTQQKSAPWYRFEWNSGKQQFDAEHHWVGRINHLPMTHCNLKLMGTGKLVQRKFIAAGEALTFDYGVEWWTHRVTGVS